jgi:hypothetical protein
MESALDAERLTEVVFNAAWRLETTQKESQGWNLETTNLLCVGTLPLRRQY